jgi:hypothetical protein
VAALREVLTGRTDDTSPRPEVAGDRRLVAAGLACVMLLAVGLRLVPVIFVPSMNWGDEIFQTTEPAHRLVYGYGLMTWEFQLGMRSWLLPGVLAGLIEIARVAGDGPQYYLPAIALGLGAVACGPVACGFLWGRRWFGPSGGLVAAFALAVAPELAYFGARALNDVVAAHLLVIALYLLEPGDKAGDRRRLCIAGFVLGIVCLLRLQLAPAVALAALWASPGPWADTWRARLPAVISGGVAAVLFGAALDWATLGYPLASVWRNYFYNIHLGVSSGFSVAPWYFYLLGELGVWGAATPFVVLLAALGARRMPLLAAAAIVIVAVHSAIPHKEYRFIYPAMMLAMVLAAIGLAQLAAWAAQWLRGRGLRPGLAAVVCAVAVMGWWGVVAHGAWSSGAIAALRNRAHDELSAMAFVRDMPALCGVGLYGEEAWVRYGGYSTLHRPVPMYWPKDVAELAASAAAFDVLLYDSAPPPELGFGEVRCFGQICVGRRPGSCEARPLPATWFPERLRNSVPESRLFEPVPDHLRPDGAVLPSR